MKERVGIRRLKVRRVADYLQNRLLALPPGGKLPGIRAVMAETGTGRMTVHHALEELRKTGLIRIDPYSGIYRIKPAAKTHEVRLLNWQIVDPEERYSFFGILFRKLRECVESSGRKLSIQYAEHRLPEELVGELVDNGITNCIICSANIPDFAECLKKRMDVCLELLPRHTRHVTGELRNSPEMTVKQMKYLFNRGYRRIGYLDIGGNDTTRYPLQVLRLLDYYRLMAENHLYVNPDWVLHCSDHYGGFETGMKRVMNSDPKPEVLIVPGSALDRLYPWCRKHGIRLGKDLAIFSCDEVDEQFTPEVTTITNHPETIASTFWQMYQAAERGENVGSRYTELFIRTGQTVPPLNAGPETEEV